MEIGLLKRDSVKVEGGDWIDNIPGMGDLRLKVRGVGSKVARKAFTSKLQARANGEDTEAFDEELLAEVRHEVILLDWGGLTNQGEDYPYDEKVAKMWCSDPDFYDFQQAVDWASSQVSARRTKVEEDLGKNSRKPSRGSSPGAP